MNYPGSKFGISELADLGDGFYIGPSWPQNIIFEDTFLHKANIDPGTGIDSFDYKITVDISYINDLENHVSLLGPYDIWLNFSPIPIKVHETADTLWVEAPQDLPSASFNAGGIDYTVHLTEVVPDQVVGINSNTTGGEIRADIFPTPVPEPATLLLLGSGLLGVAGYGRRKFFKK